MQCNKSYDNTNIFARILRKEIACKPVICDGKIIENAYAAALYDINPRNNVHVLIIPKGAYIDIHDFYTKATAQEKEAFYALICEILSHCENGKIESNFGSWQEIKHFHMHILADGWLV